MIVRYLGKKPLPYTLNTPIPYLSHSEKVGTVTFNPEAEIQDDWGEFLVMDCAGAFERVGSASASPDQAPRPVPKPKAIEDPLKYVGKRFPGKGGKWNAIAFIRKHHAESVLGIRKLKIFTKTVHWELVPIALADVTADDQKPAWNKGTTGLMKPDVITEPSADILEPSISS